MPKVADSLLSLGLSIACGLVISSGVVVTVEYALTQ